MSQPVAAAPTTHRAPPHPLREFWSSFSANHGAVAGLVVIAVLLPIFELNQLIR